MTRKIAFLAVLLALCAFPALADSSVEAAPEAPPQDAVTAEQAPAMEQCAADAAADAETGFLLTFDEELDGLMTQTEAGIYCSGWGLIPGCTTSKRCYRPDRCDYTGGVCVSNCCICY